MTAILSTASQREGSEFDHQIATLILGDPGEFHSFQKRAAAWSTERRTTFLLRAKAEKCFTQCGNALGSLLEARFSTELDRHQMITAEGREVSVKLPPDAILLKGAALSACYPDGVVRDSLDVDICVPSFETAGDVAAGMRSMGWECTTTALWAGARSNPTCVIGAIRIAPATVTDQMRGCSVEMHLSSFPTSIATGVCFEELNEMAEPAFGIGLSCRMLTATGQVCLMLADYCVRRSTPVTIRHVADMVHLLKKRGQDVDWIRVRMFVRKHRLRYGVNLLIDKAQRCGVWLRLSALTHQLEFKPSPSRLSTWYDAVLRVVLAPPQSRKRWSGRLLALGLFLLRWVLLKLAELPRARAMLLATETSLVTAALFRLGMRVAVTPISRSAGPVELLKVPGGLILRTPVGVFACTLHGFLGGRRRFALYQSYQHVAGAGS